MFQPPRCPNPDCRQHHAPKARFWVRYGTYQPRCRRRPIQRFRCRDCNKTFSRQTFRHDYRDRKHACNVPLFKMLISGSGLRQAALMVGLGVHSVQRKFHKLARTCRLLHRNLSPRLPAGSTFLIDEEETFEKASIRPLTMPVVIEKDSFFVVATMAGPIRRRAAEGTERRQLQDEEEERSGKRRDRSRVCVRATLRILKRRLPSGPVRLSSDEKSSYKTIATEVFGEHLVHETTSSTLVRSTFNPLFAINLTLAMTRDNCGRLHRKSWLVTERRRCLQRHMHLFTAYRNYVRNARNRTPGLTPARQLGLLPRPLEIDEVLAWRQDWGQRSIHPMSRRATRSVA